MARLSWLLLVVAAVCNSSGADNLGTAVTIEEFPSLAQVDFFFLGVWVQQCAGVVLTNYHILSTAHCFSGALYEDQHRRVRVGTTYRYGDGQVVPVLRAYNHPDFGSLGRDADISVVRLYTNIVFGDNVAQVPILGEGVELPFGLNVVNVGWGNTPQGGDSSDTQMYKLGLYVHDNDRCMIAYIGGEDPQYITSNMDCVGRTYNTGRDFDARDTGAPLFFENTVVGLLSFGRADGEDTYPLVATSVGPYSNWIVGTAGTV